MAPTPGTGWVPSFAAPGWAGQLDRSPRPTTVGPTQPKPRSVLSCRNYGTTGVFLFICNRNGLRVCRDRMDGPAHHKSPPRGDLALRLRLRIVNPNGAGAPPCTAPSPSLSRFRDGSHRGSGAGQIGHATTGPRWLGRASRRPRPARQREAAGSCLPQFRSMPLFNWLRAQHNWVI
jgi:hypothetical protein